MKIKTKCDSCKNLKYKRDKFIFCKFRGKTHARIDTCAKYSNDGVKENKSFIDAILDGEYA